MPFCIGLPFCFVSLSCRFYQNWVYVYAYVSFSIQLVKSYIAVDRVKWIHVQTITMEHQSHLNSRCHHQQLLPMWSLLSVALDLSGILQFLGSIHHLMAKDSEIGRMLKRPLTTRYLDIGIVHAFESAYHENICGRVVHKCLLSNSGCFLWFLLCGAMLAWYMQSSCVCPSVCQSVTSRHCTKTGKRLYIGSCKQRHTIAHRL